MKKSISLIIFSMLVTGVMSIEAQEQLTRQRYRELVVDYSQVLRQAREKTVGTRAAEKIAFKGYLPKLDIQGDGNMNLKYLDSFKGDGPGIYNVGTAENPSITYLPGTYHNYTFSANAVLSQAIYVGGAISANNKIAKADNRLSELSEEMTLDQINYQADAIYWNASAARGMLDAAIEYREIIKKQYDVIEERFNDGMISRSDFLMIATRLQESELQYIKADQNYQIAFQQLNILCGNDPKTMPEKLCPIGAVCEGIIRLDLDQVLERRADFKITDVNIEKARAAKTASLSKYNPQLSAYLAAGWGTATPHMGAKVSFNPIVGVNLNVPILRWGERFQVSRQQRSYETIQTLQKSYIKDNINQELTGALTKVNESEKMIVAAKKNMEFAQESLDLITFSYNEGKANIVDVLSAQLSWTQANNNMINAFLANKMSVAEYRKTISE